MWNSTGTVSVTNGSPVVTGAGTVFSFPNAQPGQAFVGPNGLPMEIASVDSASQITLARPYGGATAAGQPFTILPTQSFANDLALAFAGFKNTAGAMLDTIGQGMFPDGTVATPGVRFAADQDTGLVRTGDNTLGVSLGGVLGLTFERARTVLRAVASGENQNQSGADQVYHSLNFYSNAGLNVGGIAAYKPVNGFVDAGGLTFSTSVGALAERMRITHEGKVGMGTAAPQNRLHLAVGQSDGIRLTDVVNGKDLYITMEGGRSQFNSNQGIDFAENGTTSTMRLSGGNVLVGVTSGVAHAFTKNVSEGSDLLYIYSTACLNGAVFGAVSQQGWNSAKAALYLGKNSTTGRSISAAGTINASGADYAEYVRKSLACGTILKGDVCGIDRNGELTRTWADARRYVVKSTDPNLVGGDTWAAHLGPRPEAPLYAAPAYDGPAEPTEADGRSSLDAYTAAQDDYAKAVAAAEAAHAAAVKDYAAALTAWEVELEAARQTVDRIAFSGQVPVNVDADTLAACQAALGDGVAVYLVAVANGDGIGAAAVRETDMTLPLYMRRLGVVWAIRDGRPWIDVQHG
jgi:hypothetical protein